MSFCSLWISVMMKQNGQHNWQTALSKSCMWVPVFTLKLIIPRFNCMGLALHTIFECVCNVMFIILLKQWYVLGWLIAAAFGRIAIENITNWVNSILIGHQAFNQCTMMVCVCVLGNVLGIVDSAHTELAIVSTAWLPVSMCCDPDKSSVFFHTQTDR